MVGAIPLLLVLLPITDRALGCRIPLAVAVGIHFLGLLAGMVVVAAAITILGQRLEMEVGFGVGGLVVLVFRTAVYLRLGLPGYRAMASIGIVAAVMGVIRLISLEIYRRAMDQTSARNLLKMAAVQELASYVMVIVLLVGIVCAAYAVIVWMRAVFGGPPMERRGFEVVQGGRAGDGTVPGKPGPGE